MHKCPKCSTEFEGNFCPECGAKWEEEKKCPKCGKTLAGGVKFCPDCGYSFVSAPAAAPRPAPAASPVTAGTKKLYAFVSVFPAVLLSLLSVVFMLLFLAPVAVMPGGELLGQTIPSESYGNVYEISNFEGSSLTGSLTMLIVFAACALFLTAAIIFTALFIKARYHRVTVLGKQVYLRNFLTGLGYVLFFLLFLISCILLGQISSEDGGFGIFTAGAAPILTLVFSLIGCLIAIVCALAGAYLRKSYPVLVAAEKKKIADAKPTGFETWLKYHKKAAVALSILLIAAVVIGVSVPVAIANRHNGVYYVYNGETEEYNKERFYKLSGSTWQDEEGNKGEIVFDGENVTLTYNASGGIDKTGMSKVEKQGTLVNDVLKLNGTVYAKGGHKHEFGEWKTEKEATCIEKGLEKQVCICGKTEERETALVDHAWEKVDIAATCAEAGYEGNRCPVCGKEEGTYKEALHIRYSLSSDKKSYTVTGLSSQCQHSDIVIPETYKGLPVTSVGSSAFSSCSGLTSITIPDSVTSIGSSAFSGCSGLESITVSPDNSKYSSQDGILYNKEKTEFIQIPKAIKGAITIPESVTSIGAYAFAGCSSLESITIPDGVTSIGYEAFRGCSGLEHITVSEENANYCSKQDCLIEIATNKLILGCNNSIIPSDVTSIGDCAFDGCSGLTSIVIPNGITSIGYEAFRGCSGLTEVYWNAENCTKVGVGISSSWNHSLFLRCTQLAKVTFGENVKMIPAYAFRYCSGLTSIEIPDSVTSIGDEAFYSCSGLERVTIGSGVTSIGKDAFRGCSKLTSIIIPDSVTSIGSCAFRYSGLTSVTIGSGVTSINSHAFSDCTDLTSIYWNAENCTWAGRLYGTDDRIFLYCTQLTTVVFGENVKTIPACAFSGCSGLTSIVIPNNVTSIGSSAFAFCSGLTSIIIPDSVTSIEEDAFRSCSNLTNIQFKGTVKEWQTIEKESEWNYNTDDYTITCTDGTIDKEGNVTYFEQ